MPPLCTAGADPAGPLTAAAAGIVTIGVGRQAMHDQMSGLGAAACIDYTREDLARRTLTLAGGLVDAIADLTGGTLAAAALPRCDPVGRSPRSPRRCWTWTRCWMPTSPSTACSSATTGTAPGSSRPCLTGALRPIISHVLPLAAAAQAHRILERRHAGGKIVLDRTSS